MRGHLRDLSHDEQSNMYFELSRLSDCPVLLIYKDTDGCCRRLLNLHFQEGKLIQKKNPYQNLRLNHINPTLLVFFDAMATAK